MEIKKLISFDFDDTLVHTTLPAEGKQIWKEKTGEEWPHRGWWSKPESLDMEIFDIPLNKKIYRRYQKAISDPNNYVILATGRVAPLKDEVDIILNHYGLEFDETHLNPGIDTFEFKSNLFAKLIYELQPEEFIMYDDRQEHLVRFVQWAKHMPCKVTIIDAISGEEFKSEQDPLIESIKRILREELLNESDPKIGTGKKPEGSSRRLYTDENPNDTVSVKFRTKEDIVDTLNKDSFKSKPHKRQSQIINLIHQRVRVAYHNAKDPETKERLKRAYDYIESVKEKSKEKTIKLQKGEQNEAELTEKCWAGYTQKGMKTMFGKRYPNCVKKTK